MKTFLVIWFGQFISQIGTALTRFALLIWVYQQHHRAMDVALLGFFAFLPALLVSPVAGVWVDRLDRRKVTLWADAGAGLMTALLLAIHLNDGLQVWHLYAAQLLAGIAECFQNPAYAAMTTLLVDKSHYARINGLRSLAHNGALVVAPFLAGLLVVWLGLGGVLLLDLATALVAVGTLLSVAMPRLDVVVAAGKASSLWQDMHAALAYIRVRPGLIGLMLLYMAINFIAALTFFSMLPALILARSGGDEFALAVVQATLGGAAVAGGVIVSLWGGPRRKIHGVLLGTGFSFLSGDLWFGLGRTLPHWVIGAACGAVVFPLIDSSSMAILQAKVVPAMQGRFFALFHMARQSLIPVGYLLAGLLADRWLEPAMSPTGTLAPQLGWLVGTGPGAGIALMFVSAALLGSTVCGAGYLFPAVRNIEDELADHDVRTPSAPGNEALVQMG
ncbi:MAG: MFS transporter [Chloroflexi bacterium]|nr:MAG: MFS transporter [Chloroflexota bacterium]